MKIKKNDTVLVVTGKDAGKVSKVVEVRPKENRVLVDGVNLQKKHKKPRSAQEPGGIMTQIGPIDASNVMVVCPKCNKAVRVAYSEVNGKKIRVCKKCGASLDAQAASQKKAKKGAKAVEAETAEKETTKAKTAKKTAKTVADGAEKKTATKKTTAKKTVKTEEKAE